ncbi:MAG TPA: hypothetical protein VEL81_03910 [Thermoplasmata archaeon]|nr:hypothetical protein [Thermoplasmata archaeon]
MRPPSIAMLVGIGLILVGLLAFPGGARAHEQETSVDWDVAYANVEVLGPPVYAYYATQTLPLTGAGSRIIGVMAPTGYPTITMNTGEYLVVTWSFRYVANVVVRGDLFWITRLGLDFATIGRYIDSGSGRQWIGSSSFELVPNTVYDATLVLRSIQPNFRHLHVGVSVQNVGNIPAAPTVRPIPPGGPILYGVFTDANGPVVEPLAGVTISGSPFSGTFLLLTPWPWAVAGFVAQVVIGFVFIGAMYLYGRWERKREAGA